MYVCRRRHKAPCINARDDSQYLGSCAVCGVVSRFLLYSCLLFRYCGIDTIPVGMYPGMLSRMRSVTMYVCCTEVPYS